MFYLENSILGWWLPIYHFTKIIITNFATDNLTYIIALVDAVDCGNKGLISLA